MKSRPWDKRFYFKNEFLFKHNIECIDVWISNNPANKRYSLKSYFLYSSSPTKWRQNWRNIKGFKIIFAKATFTLAVWEHRYKEGYRRES